MVSSLFCSLFHLDTETQVMSNFTDWTVFWYNGKVRSELGSSMLSLTDGEAAARLQQNGPNRLTERAFVK